MATGPPLHGVVPETREVTLMASSIDDVTEMDETPDQGKTGEKAPEKFTLEMFKRLGGIHGTSDPVYHENVATFMRHGLDSIDATELSMRFTDKAKAATKAPVKDAAADPFTPKAMQVPTPSMLTQHGKMTASVELPRKSPKKDQ